MTDLSALRLPATPKASSATLRSLGELVHDFPFELPEDFWNWRPRGWTLAGVVGVHLFLAVMILTAPPKPLVPPPVYDLEIVTLPGLDVAPTTSNPETPSPTTVPVIPSLPDPVQQIPQETTSTLVPPEEAPIIPSQVVPASPEALPAPPALPQIRPLTPAEPLPQIIPKALPEVPDAPEPAPIPVPVANPLKLRQAPNLSVQNPQSTLDASQLKTVTAPTPKADPEPVPVPTPAPAPSQAPTPKPGPLPVAPRVQPAPSTQRPDDKLLPKANPAPSSSPPAPPPPPANVRPSPPPPFSGPPAQKLTVPAKQLALPKVQVPRIDTRTLEVREPASPPPAPAPASGAAQGGTAPGTANGGVTSLTPSGGGPATGSGTRGGAAGGGTGLPPGAPASGGAQSGGTGAGSGGPPVTGGGFGVPRRPGGPAVRQPFPTGEGNSSLSRMARSLECAEISRERDGKCPTWSPLEGNSPKLARPAPVPLPKGVTPQTVPIPRNPLPKCPPGTPQGQMGLSCLPSDDGPKIP